MVEKFEQVIELFKIVPELMRKVTESRRILLEI